MTGRAAAGSLLRAARWVGLAVVVPSVLVGLWFWSIVSFAGGQ